MIARLLNELWRLKIPIAIFLVSAALWDFALVLKTLTFLGTVLSAAMILAHLVGKELLGKYHWDVGAKINRAWEFNDPARALLAVGMLAARIVLYAVILLAVVLLAGMLLRGQAMGAECGRCHNAIPATAWDNMDVLAREYNRVWPGGPDIELFAGQIQAESAWRMTATRREATGVISYGGLQVLDVTWDELKKKNPTLLSGDAAQMLQAQWGIRAGLLYDRQMYVAVKCREPESVRIDYMFRAYNGGMGNLNREISRAGSCDPDDVAAACRRNVIKLRGGKILDLCRVNLEYPVKIRKYAGLYRGMLK